MGKSIITASIVTFHNSESDIIRVIKSFLGDYEDRLLFIIDNSSNDSLSALCKDSRIQYIYNNSNIGFGAAHNVAFQQVYKLCSSYHVLLNPDVYFDSTIINDLVIKADSDSSIGLIMPKILYPDGSKQFLCKLIPTPIDLLFRRFIPLETLKKRHTNKYELRFFSYDYEAEIPIVSGCFLFMNKTLLQKINGFDERFFMYLEDVDLCRRAGEFSKVLYFPEVDIIHNYDKGSYKNTKLLKYHIKSAIKYFNKWGWIFDSKRKKSNSKILKKLDYY